MINLPLLSTPKTELRKDLASKLENILQECDGIGDISRLHSEIYRNFIDYNQELENLKQDKNADNPEKNVPSKKIDAYVKQKFHSQAISIPEMMNNTYHQSHFSFDSYDNTDTSKIISQQKRKFGEF